MSRPQKMFLTLHRPQKTAKWGPKKPKTTPNYGPQKEKNDPKIRSTLKVKIQGSIENKSYSAV